MFVVRSSVPAKKRRAGSGDTHAGPFGTLPIGATSGLLETDAILQPMAIDM